MPRSVAAVGLPTVPTNTRNVSNRTRLPRLPQPPFQLETDDLGKLAQQAAARLQQISFRDLCQEARGPSCIHPRVGTIDHPAGAYLSRLRRVGVPVLQSTPPWSRQRRLRALRRGCHKSAKGYESFLRQEMAQMVTAGQYLVLPASLVLDLPNLRLSPMGVVPQRERRPRPIIDYSFYEVNEDTVRLAPPSMQFGRALDRVLRKVHQADPRQGDVHLLKLDIADAFMRIPLQLACIPTLGALLPRMTGEPQLVAFPLILPMGWVESPPYFCSVSETIADLTNNALQQLQGLPHRLESLADIRPPRLRTGHRRTAKDTSCQLPPPRYTAAPCPPIRYADVYMDDEIGVVQGDSTVRRQTRQAFLHSVDQVLRPLDPGDRPTRKEPTSVKKLSKGDAAWTTRKNILGWLVDTRRKTLSLPEHRRHRLDAILHSISPTQHTTSLRKWRKLLGELRSMTAGLPAARGLYSHLQVLLPGDQGNLPPNTRLALTAEVHASLDDFRWIAATLHDRPTRLAELYPAHSPQFLGAVDAAAQGMGGVWSVPDGLPLLWRAPFPHDLQRRVVSDQNPSGDLTNSDLELAGLVSHYDVLAQAVDVRERTLHVLSDNVAALAWRRKGSTSNLGPRSHLLRLHAAHQRHHRYCAQASHIAGTANAMADDLSRLWHLSDDELLSHFSHTYPQPRPWKLCHLTNEMLSATISSLRNKTWRLEQLVAAHARVTPLSTSGPLCSQTSAAPPISPIPTKPSPTWPSLHNDTGRGPSPPWDSLSKLEPWRTPYALWRRPTRWLASPI